MLLMFTQKGIFTTTQLDPRKNSIKSIQKKDKKLSSALGIPESRIAAEGW